MRIFIRFVFFDYQIIIQGVFRTINRDFFLITPDLFSIVIIFANMSIAHFTLKLASYCL